MGVTEAMLVGIACAIYGGGNDPGTNKLAESLNQDEQAYVQAVIDSGICADERLLEYLREQRESIPPEILLMGCGSTFETTATK